MARKSRSRVLPPTRRGKAKIVKSNPMAHMGNCRY